MSNKSMGNRFEDELCELLAKHGWWAHNMAQNKAGQPADVIAVKNDRAMLIDCKVCINDTFPLSRIEANQEAAMAMWQIRGNSLCGFALKLSNGDIHFISFDQIKNLLKNDVKVIHTTELKLSAPFEAWLRGIR